MESSLSIIHWHASLDSNLGLIALSIKSSSFSDISSEITKAKENFIGTNTSTIEKIKEDIEEVTGPIKRQL